MSNNLRLREVQGTQLDFDERHWAHAPGFATIRHSTLHMGKLLGKLSAYCEAAEHGDRPTEAVINEEVIPDLLAFAARLANNAGIDLAEAYDNRTKALDKQFTTKG